MTKNTPAKSSSSYKVKKILCSLAIVVTPLICIHIIVTIGLTPHDMALLGERYTTPVSLQTKSSNIITPYTNISDPTNPKIRVYAVKLSGCNFHKSLSSDALSFHCPPIPSAPSKFPVRI
uniref:Uncharacterized protein n=1 Tax=Proboscia inermis TaxID=420281 RepID=A0A7S0GC85_9STRA